MPQVIKDLDIYNWLMWYLYGINLAEHALIKLHGCAYGSNRQQRCHTIIFLSEIVFLSSLDPKRPKTVKTSFKQPLIFFLQFIMRDIVECVEKVSRKCALGLTNPYVGLNRLPWVYSIQKVCSLYLLWGALAGGG